MKCTLTKSDGMEDWWLIERAEHNSKTWMERTEFGMAFMHSARLGNADIEGTSDEMLAIARSIERSQSASFKRCAAEHTADGYEMSSPRNSTSTTLITHAEAKALAADIRAKIEARALSSSVTDAGLPCELGGEE